jgi:N-methylhydantoinase A/oxoprolinase/acetone carboxylase beta subunit
MPVLLGIDTGGTYTDAVLLDEEIGILAAAKSPTTRYDLAQGIRHALQKLLSLKKAHVNMVSLSSTLATNAVVEGRGSPAGLILIGYDPDTRDQDVFKKIESENPLILIRGGHKISGDEKAPLDTNALKGAVEKHAGKVSAFAVSGYFSVRNPSHELAAKTVIRQMTDLPVTCGHELTTHLDAPRRAVTALLNARLIPLIYELVHSVLRVMADFKIHAPLMIVKGDGSLVSAETALDIPLETIMSGPAASVVGARYLAGCENALVVDMGGTTSDMALLKDGAPVISEQNSSVGGFHPMIESIDIFTQGIGGDSLIRVNSPGESREIQVGPMRALPLCVLGSRYPEIIEILKSTLNNGLPNSPDNSRPLNLPLFLINENSATSPCEVSEISSELLDLSAKGPLFIPGYLTKKKYPSVYIRNIEYVLHKGLRDASSFTPTDAVNILGLYETGAKKAAYFGGAIIAERLEMDVEDFSRRVTEKVHYNLSSAMARCVLRTDNNDERIAASAADSFFMDQALKKDHENLLSFSMSLGCSVAGVGAPAATYLPEAASLLNCAITVPDNAPVANAVGAVTGSVSQTVRVLIKPGKDGASFRVHSARGINNFTQYQDAEDFALEAAKEMAVEKARSAGAENIEIHVAKKNTGTQKQFSAKESHVLIQTEIRATAVGRPRMTVLKKKGRS